MENDFKMSISPKKNIWVPSWPTRIAGTRNTPMGLSICPKTKIFIWRAYLEIIPTQANLAKRKIVDFVRCSFCNGGVSSNAMEEMKIGMIGFLDFVYAIWFTLISFLWLWGHWQVGRFWDSCFCGHRFDYLAPSNFNLISLSKEVWEWLSQFGYSAGRRFGQNGKVISFFPIEL